MVFNAYPGKSFRVDLEPLYKSLSHEGMRFTTHGVLVEKVIEPFRAGEVTYYVLLSDKRNLLCDDGDTCTVVGVAGENVIMYCEADPAHEEFTLTWDELMLVCSE